MHGFVFVICNYDMSPERISSSKAFANQVYNFLLLVLDFGLIVINDNQLINKKNTQAPSR